MSQRLSPLESPITIELDGKSLPAREGEPVAVSLIAAGEALFGRSSKYHRPRGAYCLSGGCAQCLMRVDGRPNVQTCREPARPGMRLERQNAFPDANLDVFAATDLVFRDWFNHHEFLAGVPIAETVMLKVARVLSGLGKLPDGAGVPPPPAVVEACEVAIVGGGTAGLAAASLLAERGVAFTLFEQDPELGGRFRDGVERGPVPALPRGGQVRTGATVLGLYADDGAPTLLVLQAGRVHLVRPRRVLLTHGGQPPLAVFADNDLPGIYAGRAVARLVGRFGVAPGSRVAVVGEASEAKALAALLASKGLEPVAVGAEPIEAHGLGQVSALTVRLDGREQKVDCDAVAVCAPLTPSYELARSAGAKVRWNGQAHGFEVVADAQGLAAANTWVAGELRGPVSAADAQSQGRAAAEAIAASLAGGAA